MNVIRHAFLTSPAAAALAIAAAGCTGATDDPAALPDETGTLQSGQPSGQSVSLAHRASIEDRETMTSVIPIW
jgi:hypothetical protein